MTEFVPTEAGLYAWPEEISRKYKEQGVWGNENFANWLTAKLKQYADVILLSGPDLQSGEWQQMTGQEISAVVNNIVEHCHSIGLGRGDKVVMQMGNNNAFVLTFFALLQLGVIPVMALPGHGQREILHFVKLTQARAWFVSEQSISFDCHAFANELLNTVPTLKHVVVDGLDLKPHPSILSLLGFTKETEAQMTAPEFLGLAADPAEMALLLCSGGTTGIPKLIPRTHRDYLYNIKASAKLCELSSQDRYLVALPAAHNFPLACPGILGAIEVGAGVVMCPVPSPEIAFEYIEKAGVTVTALVPTLVKTWLNYAALVTPPAACLDLLQVGGAKLDEATARRIGNELNCNLQQVFGMAEGLLNFTRNSDPSVLKLKTQGRPLSDLDEVRVVDEQGQDVAKGKCGELLTRGPYTIRGYYKDEQANQKSFTTEGYYRTGDQVRRLSSGHLIVEGRIQEVLRRGGETISVETLEAHLACHHGIKDVAVVGLPCEQLGERTCAVIVSQDPNSPKLALKDVRQYLAAQGVARYMLPDTVAYVEHIPLTVIGKIARKKLSEKINFDLNKQQIKEYKQYDSNK